MDGPLEDITVIDFAQLVQGPLATQMLGDMGAEVIKIEPPGGEWMRSQWSMHNAFEDGKNLTFLTANRNKKSVELDIKDDEQLEIVYDIVEDADVFLENLRPRVVDRIGLGYEELSERNSELIYCSASGYGESGPYSDWPGQDLIIQGISGLASLTGRRDDPPTPTGLPVADFYSAANLAFAIVSAIHHRERTGEGQRIEGDLLSAAVNLQAMELDTYLNTGDPPVRSEAGIAHPYYQAPFGVYQTEDGYMTLSLSMPSEVGEALDIDKIKDINTWEEAYENRDQIKKYIEEKLQTNTTDHWIDVLVEYDIWCGPVKSLPEVADDPQVKENDMIQTVEHETLGEIELTGVPFRMSETPGTIRRAPPTCGENTDEVLKEHGYTDEFIEEVMSKNGRNDE